MNMDTGMVNRALLDAGHEILDAQAFQGGGDEETVQTVALCKQYYLQTFLEALSEVAWTGGTKRSRLMKTGVPRRDTGFRFVYDLPLDCARPLELLGKGYFQIEGRFLCTEEDKAELLYVSNGRILPTVSLISGESGDAMDTEYLSSGGACDALALESGDDGVVTLSGGNAAEALEAETWLFDENGEMPADHTGEDFPDYRPPEYEPKFYEYVEKALAAKLAANLTRKMDVHSRLLQEALLIKQQALTASMSTAAAKRRPEAWWKDRLGL
jgi:hypothetical protein